MLNLILYHSYLFTKYTPGSRSRERMPVYFRLIGRCTENCVLSTEYSDIEHVLAVLSTVCFVTSLNKHPRHPLNLIFISLVYEIFFYIASYNI